MAFSKPLLFIFLVSLFISPLSCTDNEEASSSENNDCYKLKSTVSALPSIIKEKHQEVLTKEEKIQILENQVKHASEVDEKVYQLQKQIFELRREVEMQHKRRPEVETQAEIADKIVAELSSKLESIDGKWFFSKLGLYQNKTLAYVMTLWHHPLSQALQITLQKKWIPSIKDACVTLTIYLEPKVQYITEKSIEVLYTSKKALTPNLNQGFDISYYYLEVIQNMTILTQHLENVQVALEPYIENVRHGFKKLVNSTTFLRGTI